MNGRNNRQSGIGTGAGAGLFGELTYAPQQSMYVGLPTEEIIKTGKAAHDMYEAVQTGFDELDVELGAVQVDDLDKPIVKNLKTSINDMIDKGLKSQGFHKMKNDLTRTLKAYKNDELLQQAQTRYKKDQEWLESLKTLDVPKYWKEGLILLHKQSKKPLTKDAEGNVVGGTSFRELPPKYVDIEKEITTFIQGLKVDEVHKITGVPKGVAGYFLSGSEEGITYDQAYKIAKNRITENPMYKEQLDFDYQIQRVRTGNPNSYSLIETFGPALQDATMKANITANVEYNKLTDAEKEALPKEKQDEMINTALLQEYIKVLEKAGIDVSKLDLEDLSDLIDQNPNFDLTSDDLTQEQKDFIKNQHYQSYFIDKYQAIADMSSYNKQKFSLEKDLDFEYQTNLRMETHKTNLKLALQREAAKDALALEDAKQINRLELERIKGNGNNGDNPNLNLEDSGLVIDEDSDDTRVFPEEVSDTEFTPLPNMKSNTFTVNMIRKLKNVIPDIDNVIKTNTGMINSFNDPKVVKNPLLRTLFSSIPKETLDEMGRVDVEGRRKLLGQALEEQYNTYMSVNALSKNEQDIIHSLQHYTFDVTNETERKKLEGSARATVAGNKSNPDNVIIYTIVDGKMVKEDKQLAKTTILSDISNMTLTSISANQPGIPFGYTFASKTKNYTIILPKTNEYKARERVSQVLSFASKPSLNDKLITKDVPTNVFSKPVTMIQRKVYKYTDDGRIDLNQPYKILYTSINRGGQEEVLNSPSLNLFSEKDLKTNRIYDAIDDNFYAEATPTYPNGFKAPLTSIFPSPTVRIK